MAARRTANIPGLLVAAVVMGAAVAAVDGDRQSAAYDLLRDRYARHTPADDPLGFPMKVRSVASDPYKFWRGTKDLFFAWSAEHARDWLADREAYVASHGDPHVGNLGTYPSARGPLGSMAFGLVDFDDAAVLPFQLDLLQGAITFDLLADANRISTSREQLTHELIDAYRSGLTSGRPATEMLRDTPGVARLLRSGDLLEKVLSKHLGDDGHFLPVIRAKNGDAKELLRPCALSNETLGAGLAQAVANDASLRDTLRYESAEQFAPAIVQAVRRVRLGSSGSQGLAKYFVLLRRPLKDAEHDAIVYLKEQIPSAAERAGVIPAAGTSAGERCASLARQLTDPPAMATSWCDAGGKSFVVSLRDPWSDELEPDDVKSPDDLLAYARIWGMVVGAAHARAGGATRIAPRLDDPQLLADLQTRAAAYRARLDADFQSFTADPRVAADVARAASAIDDLSKPRNR